MDYDRYDETYTDGRVFLPECLTSKTRVENVAFIGCEIIGPAVVAVEDGCVWEGGFKLLLPKGVAAESAIWPVPEEIMLGVMGVKNCRFVRCSWEWVGFVIADEVERRKMIQGVTIGRMEQEF